MDYLLLILVLLILLVSFCFKRYLDLKEKDVFPQYTNEQLRWLKNKVIYRSLEREIQSVHLNPSDDKSICYQNSNRIYCMENIRTSDIEALQKEISVNGEYLNGKLQGSLQQQYTYGQIPNLKVRGMAIENGKFIVAMELIK
ncbi:hypothetical protein ACFOZ1_15875 [Gracilibacillus marinus]|uniref:Uncharacterized protein n=1 Tax=Gracilibacillus marinus TaxID=630535 RepID=A0ABV8W1R7_9BACI